MPVLPGQTKIIQARALYDNIADTPEELAFKRGDVLYVLEQDTQGLEGWWLCSLRGKQGIVPGNRLKILPGSAQPVEAGGGQAPNWRRRSWLINPNKVLTPQKVGDVYVYDQPSQGNHDTAQAMFVGASPPGENLYDFPRSQVLGDSGPYDTPKNSRQPPFLSNRSPDELQMTYESPPNNKLVPGLYPSPPSMRAAGDDAGMATYDVLPPQANIPVGVYERPRSNRSSCISMHSTGSTVSSGMSNTSGSSLSSRSSSDIQPLDFYDTPKKREVVSHQNSSSALDNHSKSSNACSPPLSAVVDRSSGGSGLEDYDSPPSRPQPVRKAADPTDIDYDVPTSNKEVPKPIKEKPKYSSTEDLLEDYDTPVPIKETAKVLKRHSAGDVLEDYDTPVSKFELKRRSNNLPAKQKSSNDLLDCDSQYKDSLLDQHLKRSQSADLLDSGVEFGEIYDVLPQGPKTRVAKSMFEESVYDNACGVPMRAKGTRVEALKSSYSVDQSYDMASTSAASRDSAVSMRSSGSLRSSGSSRPSSGSVESRSSDIPPIFYDELRLPMAKALDILGRLQQDLNSSSTKLLSFVNNKWRTEQILSTTSGDIKVTSSNLKKYLQELVDFGQGSLANSAKVEDKTVMRKIIKYLEPVQELFCKIQKCVKSLDELKWEPNKLASMVQDPHSDHLGMLIGCCKDLSNLSRMLTTVIQGNAKLLFPKTETEASPVSKGASPPATKPKPPVAPKPSMKRMDSNGSGNASNGSSASPAIQARPLPTPPVKTEVQGSPRKSLGKSPASSEVKTAKIPPGQAYTILDDNDYENDSGDWLEYDYVALESPKRSKRRSENTTPEKLAAQDTQSLDAHTEGELPSGLSAKFKERFKKIQKASEKQVVTYSGSNAGKSPDGSPTAGGSSGPCEADKQILKFYTKQAETHSKLLTDAIDAFFAAVDYNQPPKVFIAHSKFVILAAHKLVYIGDTVHRNVRHEDVRNKVMHCANHLCEKLKVVVTVTKTAALQFPALKPIQDMVDQVVDVSHAARDLRLAITQAAEAT